jgi:hypothetical protein
LKWDRNTYVARGYTKKNTQYFALKTCKEGILNVKEYALKTEEVVFPQTIVSTYESMPHYNAKEKLQYEMGPIIIWNQHW